MKTKNQAYEEHVSKINCLHHEEYCNSLCFDEGFDARDAEVERLKRQLEVAKDALICISSKNKPRHEQEEYWIKISHERCATVLATDTKIARQILQEIEKIDGEE